MSLKKCLVFLVVLAVFCSAVWAFPTQDEIFSKDSSSQDVTIPLKVGSSVTKDATSSISAQNVTSNDALTLLESLNDKSRLTKSELAAHKEALQDLADDYGMLLADKNAMHPFVDAGVKFGFNGGVPVLGGVIGGGVKFNFGMTVRASVAYDCIKLKKSEIWDGDWAKDKFSAQLTIGYEF